MTTSEQIQNIRKNLSSFISNNIILSEELANIAMDKLVADSNKAGLITGDIRSEKNLTTLEFNHYDGSIIENEIKVSVRTNTGRCTWYFGGERVSRNEVLDSVIGSAIKQ
ncbi:hypothetical protein VCHA53O466_50015 [Vibrio chagasii]|nr:hypothetical protein VCHA53O466_50015 [Vibrio chagasii]